MGSDKRVMKHRVTTHHKPERRHVVLHDRRGNTLSVVLGLPHIGTEGRAVKYANTGEIAGGKFAIERRGAFAA